MYKTKDMITLIESIEGEKLISLWKKSYDYCMKNEKVSNLILSGVFPFSETNSDWINGYKEKAKEWQESVRPSNLVLNHGEYIDRYKSKFNKTGIEYIIEELKSKADSNRACWSLYDMSTLIDSEDKSIPSFMILQAGISEDNKILSLTAYYRALEVSKFLPINIAENCLIAEKLNSSFSFKFEQFALTIHAFNGYVKENFSCLEKASIDLLDEGTIMLEIVHSTSAKKWIQKELINKKETIESRIDSRGIELLVKCIELYNNRKKESIAYNYPDVFILKLKSISIKINEYNKIVYTSTYTSKAKDKYSDIIKEINDAINLL